MQSISIYLSDNSDLAEYEAINKGYRVDVFVKVGNGFFNLRIYTLTRLQQDFETEFEADGFYSVEPNLVLVNDTNRTEIINTINQLQKQKYFEHIKESIDSIDISKLAKIQ
ncbi:MAG: hypothetical protein LBH28_05580 [Oscillospiraceae bacterium]|jgi:hypothetical protein|nr:hypothetical protein [Oscillospiraceae bacterium]